MLKKAGFKHISYFWSNKHIDPRWSLNMDLNRKINNQYQYSISRSLLKYTVYRGIQKLSQSAFLNKIILSQLLRLSLFQSSFVAEA